MLKNKEKQMKLKFAIPLENGVLCNHFGHCQQFSIIDIDNDQITREEMVTPPPHEPGLLPAWLAEKGVTDVIAGGMGQKAIQLFQQNHIDVYIGVKPKNPSELVMDWLNNNLEKGTNACTH